MGIESLKRWHWALIGLTLGVLIAWVQISIGVDGYFASGEHKTIGKRDFEEGLRAAPLQGRPIIDQLTVYPDGKRFVLRMRRVEHNPKYPKNDRHYLRTRYSLITAAPYAPATDRHKTVEVAIAPAESQVHVNLSADRGPGGARFDGWGLAGGMSRDPGSGATVAFELRPANYKLTVIVDPSNTSGTMDQLTPSLNGHPLPPLSHEAGSSASHWQTDVARDFISDTPQQTLRVARLGSPIAIREIHLVDPKYTVLDYLKEALPGNKPVAYRFGWWVKPNATLAIWSIGALVLVGGIWPTILNLLVGAGYGRPISEPKYDFNRFQSEPVTDQRKPSLTQEDLENLQQMEDRLFASVATGPDAIAPLEESMPPGPRVLDSGAIAPSAPIEGPTKETKRSYKGEFYPVVRSDGEKKDQ